MREILQMDRIMEKLTILSAAARYDVACTSSGVQRGGDGTHTGNAYASGICHAFTGDGRCISLLKILYTNDCIYDCKYCRNRCSNDVKRVSFTPEEICKLTMEFYRRNYIEGLFLSSGILHSPDYTMGLLYETLYLLRTKYHFNGYIHVKGIPGASADLLELTGYLADRMSVNLELPTADALRQIAPNKVRKNILSPMRQLQNGIRQSREFHGVSSMKSRMYLDEKTYYNQMAEMKESYARLQDYHDGIAAIREHKARQSAVQSWGEEIAGGENSSRVRNVQKKLPQTTRGLMRPDHYFVPAGQSTQMVIGASDESDYQIISVSEALYQKFEMKRIFYSAFINVNHDSSLPDLPGHHCYVSTGSIRQIFCCGFMDSAQMNCCQRKIRILTNRLIRSVIGQCTIWNCFRWKLIVRIIIRCFVCRGSEPKVPAGLWRPGGTKSWIFQI